METRSNNVLVGAFVLLFTLALAGFVVWLANDSGGPKREFDIFFKQSVDGLTKGAQVQYSGVPVGQDRLEHMYNAPSATPVKAGRVTMDDVIMKTHGLFAIVLAFGAAGWFAAATNPGLGFMLWMGGMIGTLILGLVIVLFLVFEPEGLYRMWRRTKDYFRLWPFAY